MQTVVGVVRGGAGSGHDASLAEGAAMIAALPEARYETRDFYVDRAGVWHLAGRPIAPERALRQVDVALLAHGTGDLENLLERAGTRYAGADSFGARLSLQGVLASHAAHEAGLLSPNFRYIERAADAPVAAREVVRAFLPPVTLSAVGFVASPATAAGYGEILAAIEALFAAGALGVLAQEPIRGRETVVSVVEGLRGEALYALPAAELFTDGDQHCPARFTKSVAAELAAAAKQMHQVLALRHYSQSRFMLAPRGVYHLSTSPRPSAQVGSSLALALEAVGLSLADFYAHLVSLALTR